MRIARNFGGNRSRTDMAWLAYFSVMACLFTKTYIQLAAQLGIIAYTLFRCSVNSKLRFRKTSMRHVYFLLGWMGVLTALAELSKQWAYSTKAGSNTVLTLFRILAIGGTLLLYVDSRPKAVAVVKAFIYSSVLMGAVALLTTPISEYGQAGEEGFGTAIGQQRNTLGAVMAFLVPVCLILEKEEGFKGGKKIAAFFVFVLLCSGSRGAMLQLLIVATLYILLAPGLKKKLRSLGAGALLAIVALALIYNVPYLYQTVWVRISDLFATVLGTEQNADSSAQARELYKVLAFQMFLSRPLLGYGVDGFYCRLRDLGQIAGVQISHVVYSHCNFAELAADFGILGLLAWYVPVFSVWRKCFRQRNSSEMMRVLFILLTSMIILDYARIPWSNHSGMYQYYTFLLLFFFFRTDERRAAERAQEG